MANLIHKITDANIYIEGENMLGRSSEVTMPEIVGKTVEHKGLGMIGMVDFWAGFEKMELKIKWNSYYRDAMIFCSNPKQTVQIEIRSSVNKLGSQGIEEEKPFVCSMIVQFNKVPGLDFKQHEEASGETTATVFSMRQELDGQPVIEIDIPAGIYKVDGEDILSQYRENLGI